TSPVDGRPSAADRRLPSVRDDVHLPLFTAWMPRTDAPDSKLRESRSRLAARTRRRRRNAESRPAAANGADGPSAATTAGRPGARPELTANPCQRIIQGSVRRY